MNKAQTAVLGIAVAAGGAAFTMTNRESPPPAPVQAGAPSQVSLEHVLVATRDLPYGAQITDADMRWIEWPKDATPHGALTRNASPNAQTDLRTAFVRVPISGGEPIRRERLVKGATAGLMSTMISPGKRAVAIDVALNNTAGGFILPNDRVDVLHTFRDAQAQKELGYDVANVEVVLRNVRVLAIGQAIDKKASEAVAVGTTATLELDPREAELIVLAQRNGQLFLALRPITDAFANEDLDEPNNDARDQTALTVVRRGVSSVAQPR